MPFATESRCGIFTTCQFDRGFITYLTVGYSNGTSRKEFRKTAACKISQAHIIAFNGIRPRKVGRFLNLTCKHYGRAALFNGICGHIGAAGNCKISNSRRRHTCLTLGYAHCFPIPDSQTTTAKHDHAGGMRLLGVIHIRLRIAQFHRPLLPLIAELHREILAIHSHEAPQIRTILHGHLHGGTRAQLNHHSFHLEFFPLKNLRKETHHAELGLHSVQLHALQHTLFRKHRHEARQTQGSSFHTSTFHLQQAGAPTLLQLRLTGSDKSTAGHTDHAEKQHTHRKSNRCNKAKDDQNHLSAIPAAVVGGGHHDSALLCYAHHLGTIGAHYDLAILLCRGFIFIQLFDDTANLRQVLLISGVFIVVIDHDYVYRLIRHIRRALTGAYHTACGIHHINLDEHQESLSDCFFTLRAEQASHHGQVTQHGQLIFVAH